MSYTKRFLAPKLKSFLDEELSPKIVNPVACFLEAAKACVGIVEEGGDNRGPMVEAFQSTIGGANGQSWCLSFIQALTAYVEDRFGVVSNLPLTELVAALWDKTPVEVRVTAENVQPGDLILWQYGATSKGHVGIVTNVLFKLLRTIEGNTSDSKEIDREGDGVYEKERSLIGTTNMHVLGYLRPAYNSLGAKS